MTIKTVLLTAALTCALAFTATADAAKKVSKPGKRSDYSEAQQKKFFDTALKLCQKKFPGNVARVKVDYVRRRFVCYYR